MHSEELIQELCNCVSANKSRKTEINPPILILITALYKLLLNYISCVKGCHSGAVVNTDISQQEGSGFVPVS